MGGCQGPPQMGATARAYSRQYWNSSQTDSEIFSRDCTIYQYHRNSVSRSRYEAFSGCDLDPVHVSDYHQIPYATFYPSLTMNVIYTGWAEMQLPNGTR